MSPALVEHFWSALGETLLMVGAASTLALALGLPLGVFLATTARGDVFAAPGWNRLAGGLVNAARSLPFIILLIAVIPVSRALVGTSIGTAAAIVPLSLAAVPFFARLAEASLREVHRELIEAALAMGASRLQIVREVLLPEARAGLVSAFTVTVVNLVGASAMAGAVGGGGLGDLAIRQGYQRFNPLVMTLVVAALIVLVACLQGLGDAVSRRLKHRTS